jgi:hypothetical protein
MNLPSKVVELLSKKGQIVTLTTERNMKVRKGQEPIQKRSTFQCRVGVNYDNIQAVKDKRESGELPPVNQGLPWGNWAVFPHLIEHKGEYYLRCTVLRNNFTPTVNFTRNGNLISREDAVVSCLASEFKANDDNEVFTIKVSSIV